MLGLWFEGLRALAALREQDTDVLTRILTRHIHIVVAICRMHLDHYDLLDLDVWWLLLLALFQTTTLLPAARLDLVAGWTGEVRRHDVGRLAIVLQLWLLPSAHGLNRIVVVFVIGEG